MPKGTVIIIINGSIKLSNCAARTKKISTNASRNANKVLEELSAKSLEAPASDVSNVSSKNFFSDLFHLGNAIANRFSGSKSCLHSGAFETVKMVDTAVDLPFLPFSLRYQAGSVHHGYFAQKIL